MARPSSTLRLDPVGFARAGYNVATFRNNALIHEAMHIIENADDPLMADRWGLADKGYDVSNPSVAITQFLDNDSQPKKKK